MDPDEWTLDVQLVDVEQPLEAMACTTGDGCQPSCASACLSSV